MLVNPKSTHYTINPTLTLRLINPYILMQILSLINTLYLAAAPIYIARHTWASLAHENDIPLSVISQGMGHDSEKTTKFYLAALDRSKLDEANNAIISLLK